MEERWKFMVRIIREQQLYNFQFVEKMSETRKDRKGRKLWNGESQRKAENGLQLEADAI